MKYNDNTTRWPINPELVEKARDRKRRTGIPVTRTLSDALTFAFERQGDWDVTLKKGADHARQ